jgi:hypothetical protein
MPRQRLRIDTAADQEYRARLSRIKNMGIPVGRAVDPPHEPDRLTLEQTESEWSIIYELPLNEVAVIVPATLTILKSGILITDVAMMTPWEESSIDLWDPEERPYYYKELIDTLYHQPPTFLNDWLTSGVPLRPRQVEGVIIAHGYISVPPKCHDETLVAVKLSLMDERLNELSFRFGVRVDRSVMRKCERRRRERGEFDPAKRSGLFGPNSGQLRDQMRVSRDKAIMQPHVSREFAQSAKGSGLFEPKGGQLRDQKSVSRDEAIKKPHIRGEHDATGDPRTPKIN